MKNYINILAIQQLVGTIGRKKAGYDWNKLSRNGLDEVRILTLTRGEVMI